MDSGLNRVDGLAADIRNAAWRVRHYQRGGRSSIGRAQRERAIRSMGFIVRAAFNESENFEVLLIAVVDGLRPRPDEQAF
jgi:hypothetical protein